MRQLMLVRCFEGEKCKVLNNHTMGSHTSGLQSRWWLHRSLLPFCLSHQHLQHMACLVLWLNYQPVMASQSCTENFSGKASLCRQRDMYWTLPLCTRATSAATRSQVRLKNSRALCLPDIWNSKTVLHFLGNLGNPLKHFSSPCQFKIVAYWCFI